jgi:hypothetical protein
MNLTAVNTLCLQNDTYNNKCVLFMLKVIKYVISKQECFVCAMIPTCRTFSRLFTAALYQVSHRASSGHSKRDACGRDCVHEASLSGVCNKQSSEHFINAMIYQTHVHMFFV